MTVSLVIVLIFTIARFNLFPKSKVKSLKLWVSTNIRSDELLINAKSVPLYGSGVRAVVRTSTFRLSGFKIPPKVESMVQLTLTKEKARNQPGGLCNFSSFIFQKCHSTHLFKQKTWKVIKILKQTSTKEIFSFLYALRLSSIVILCHRLTPDLKNLCCFF